jgi:hypothetical protein
MTPRAEITVYEGAPQPLMAHAENPPLVPEPKLTRIG